MRLEGPYGAPGVPHSLHYLFVRDRDAARQGIQEALSWDFDAAIIPHDHNIAVGAKPILTDAFAKLGG